MKSKNTVSKTNKAIIATSSKDIWQENSAIEEVKKIIEQLLSQSPKPTLE